MTKGEIELVSDGDGLAVIGAPADVERFLQAEGLADRAADLPASAGFLSAGSAVAQTGAVIAENSGRWLKLTEESAQAVKKYGLMDSKTPGVSHAMVGDPGKVKQWVQVAKSPGSLAANPAMLAGAAGIMSQLAMQQTMAEITDYLATIDEKLDDVLRAQTNQVLARMDGVHLAIQEAESVRGSIGRVSEVTWSKIQHSSATIMETQGYALRQLADLADKLERKARVDELAKTSKQAEAEVQKWLAALARCFQLHDAIAVLELDRVLDTSPDELVRHRFGLKVAREERLGLIARTTERLLDRMSQAALEANSKVLFNPIQSPAIIRSTNQVAAEVQEFHSLLGIEAGLQSSEARPWGDAASEQWGKVRDTGSAGARTVQRLGGRALDQAGSVKGKLGAKLPRRRGGKDATGVAPRSGASGSTEPGDLNRSET